MQISHRSYSCENFRPSPLAEMNDDRRILSVVTSWGSRDDSKRLLSKFSQVALDDESLELTSPFGKIESIGPVANQLRTITLLTNEEIYREGNKHDFVAALEVLSLCHHHSSISWVSVGCPHILLYQRGTYLLLNYQVDLSWQLRQSVPLLSRGIGLERVTQINSGRIFVDEDFELILLSRSHLPSALFANPTNDLDQIQKILVQDEASTPFWLARVTAEK